MIQILLFICPTTFNDLKNEFQQSTWIRIMNEWFYDLCFGERFLQ